MKKNHDGMKHCRKCKVRFINFIHPGECPHCNRGNRGSENYLKALKEKLKNEERKNNVKRKV